MKRERISANHERRGKISGNHEKKGRDTANRGIFIPLIVFLVQNLFYFVAHMMGKAGDKAAGTHHWYYISAKKHDFMEFDASSGRFRFVKGIDFK